MGGAVLQPGDPAAVTVVRLAQRAAGAVPVGGERVTIDADVIVCDRDYRLATTPEVRCGLYVQGATEHTHGLSSTLLSNTAIRAGEIARSLTRTPVLTH